MKKLYSALKLGLVLSLAIAAFVALAAVVSAPHFLGIIFLGASVFATIKLYALVAFLLGGVVGWFRGDEPSESGHENPA